MKASSYDLGFGLAVLLPFLVGALYGLLTKGTAGTQVRGVDVCAFALMTLSGLPFVLMLHLPRWKKVLSAVLSLPISFILSWASEIFVTCELFGNCPL